MVVFGNGYGERKEKRDNERDNVLMWLLGVVCNGYVHIFLNDEGLM